MVNFRKLINIVYTGRLNTKTLVTICLQVKTHFNKLFFYISRRSSSFVESKKFPILDHTDYIAIPYLLWPNFTLNPPIPLVLAINLDSPNLYLAKCSIYIIQIKQSFFMITVQFVRVFPDEDFIS